MRADEKEFFFTMLSQVGDQHNWYQHQSQKSLKKDSPQYNYFFMYALYSDLTLLLAGCMVDS